MLTDKQRVVLHGLAERGDKPTTRLLTDALETPYFRRARFNYVEVYGYLRRLEAKGLVERVRGDRAVHWQITPAGMDALG